MEAADFVSVDFFAAAAVGAVVEDSGVDEAVGAGEDVVLSATVLVLTTSN